MTYRIGIVGASGYTGFELIRLLAAHPQVELAALHSASMAGRPVRDLYPDFTGDHRFAELSVEELDRRGLDLVFLAMPDGYARAAAPRLAARMRVVDLSRDFRADADVVYGLPEFFRERIRGARLVANPGCYVTSCLLAARPLVAAGLVRHAIFDAKSGWSGAGRTPSYTNDPKNHAGNLIPYKLTQHKHVEEIRRFLETQVSFTPHVLPLFRGILTTAHLLLARPAEAARARAVVAAAYAGERFVQVLDRVPELRDSQGTNRCALGGFEADDTGRLVVISTIDNLLKGASGQAVQNMNLMLGLDEGMGLEGLDPRQAHWRVVEG
ncbi:MAG: N-acetyl-gamma-glutamyl-phosphate reductase [Planctomycetes bacterium]|nr:N-acetyl-gamma-glutamyl-phosphate reductase [Planctomycetota bacterium]